MSIAQISKTIISCYRYSPDTTFIQYSIFNKENRFSFLRTKNMESIIASQEIRLEKVGFNLLLLN